jgi:DNA-binding NtrC family response regulator
LLPFSQGSKTLVFNRKKYKAAREQNAMLDMLDSHDTPPPLATLDDYKRNAERQALSDALARYGTNMSVAARMLGISRPTFYRLLHKHRLR